MSSYTVSTVNVEQIKVTEETVDEADLGFKDLPGSGAPNIYVLKRNFIHQLMDVALLMANVSQLKALLSMESSDKYFYLIFVFICLSIVLQVIFTICMLTIWAIEKSLEEATIVPDEHAHSVPAARRMTPEEEERKKSIAGWLDKIGNVLVLTIIVANVFITGFGVESHDNPTPGPAQTPAVLGNATG